MWDSYINWKYVWVNNNVIHECFEIIFPEVRIICSNQIVHNIKT